MRSSAGSRAYRSPAPAGASGRTLPEARPAPVSVRPDVETFPASTEVLPKTRHPRPGHRGGSSASPMPFRPRSCPSPTPPVPPQLGTTNQCCLACCLIQGVASFIPLSQPETLPDQGPTPYPLAGQNCTTTPRLKRNPNGHNLDNFIRGGMTSTEELRTSAPRQMRMVKFCRRRSWLVQ
jgi:hypothetical protein